MDMAATQQPLPKTWQWESRLLHTRSPGAASETEYGVQVRSAHELVFQDTFGTMQMAVAFCLYVVPVWLSGRLLMGW